MIKSHKVKSEKKHRIRLDIFSKLRSQTQEERAKKSLDIKRRLFQDSSFIEACSIMFYVSKEYEVDTMPMIEEALLLKKRVIVPVTDTREKKLIPSEIKNPKAHFYKGPFGVYEPKKEYIKAVDTSDIDIVIVPGIAFDKKGNRVGHGHGYFDTFLKGLPKSIPTIGLAFDFQSVERIDIFPWDVPVTKVITA